MSIDNKKISILKKLLEQYSGKKVVLEAVTANLKTEDRIANYIKTRIAVHQGSMEQVLVRANNSHVIVTDIVSPVAAQVMKDLQGNGFVLTKTIKQLHNKKYRVLKSKTNFFVYIEQK